MLGDSNMISTDGNDVATLQKVNGTLCMLLFIPEDSLEEAATLMPGSVPLTEGKIAAILQVIEKHWNALSGVTNPYLFGPTMHCKK